MEPQMSEQRTNRLTKLNDFKNISADDLAIISKLIPPGKKQGEGDRRHKGLEMPNGNVVSKLARGISDSINDANNLFQMLPDMDLCRQIVVSAILSPSDLTSSDLVYSIGNDELDSNLTGPCLRKIKEFFETVYRIKKLLPEILSDALFMKGSYPMLILPESTIDYAINTAGRPSMETLGDHITEKGWYRPYGVLGKSGKAIEGDVSSFESLFGNANSIGSATQDEFQISFEGIEKHVTIGGKAKTVKFNFPGKIEVTDNPEMLKNPMLMDRLRQHRVQEVYGARRKSLPIIAMEAAKKAVAKPDEKKTVAADLAKIGDTQLIEQKRMPMKEVENKFFARRNYQHVPLQPLLTPKQLNRPTVGHPVMMHLPSESVIPVHVPGNVRQHVGYFILMDVNGNPLSMASRNNYYDDIRNGMSPSGDVASSLLTMTRRVGEGINGWNPYEIDEMAKAHASIVEDDLRNRLRSGAISGEYDFSLREETMRLMFSRQAAAKNTMVLFVPAEMLIYVAFDYNEFGIGRSMLEDGKILGSIRASLLLAATTAAITNATGGQTITIKVPEEDKDPYGTVEFMLNQYAEINGSGFPLGSTHPMDLMYALANAGKNIVVTGNSAFPEVEFDVQTREGTAKEPSSELTDDLRKRHIQMFGLTPEVMDAAQGSDFATTVVNNQLMFLKRVLKWQEDFEPFLVDWHRGYISNSGTLMEELMDLIMENKKYLKGEYSEEPEKFLNDLIGSLSVTLPPPQTNRMTEQMEQYDKYTDSITKGLDAYFNEALFDATAAAELFDSIPTTKAAYLAYFQRKWLREHNVLPELDVFNTVKEEDTPVINILKENEQHMEGVLACVEEYMKEVNDSAIARRERLETAQAKRDGTWVDPNAPAVAYDAAGNPIPGGVDAEGNPLPGQTDADGNVIPGVDAPLDATDPLDAELMGDAAQTGDSTDPLDGGDAAAQSLSADEPAAALDADNPEASARALAEPDALDDPLAAGDEVNDPLDKDPLGGEELEVKEGEEGKGSRRDAFDAETGPDEDPALAETGRAAFDAEAGPVEEEDLGENDPLNANPEGKGSRRDEFDKENPELEEEEEEDEEDELDEAGKKTGKKVKKKKKPAPKK